MKKFTSALLSICMLSSINCFAAEQKNQRKEHKSFVSAHPILTTLGLVAVPTLLAGGAYAVHNMTCGSHGDKSFNPEHNPEHNPKHNPVHNLELNDELLNGTNVSMFNYDIVNTARWNILSGCKIAVVNAANSMLGGPSRVKNFTGISKRIYESTYHKNPQTGKLVLEECLDSLPADESGCKCKPGNVVVTDGYGLGAFWDQNKGIWAGNNVTNIIHTVAPNVNPNSPWPGNCFNEWNEETHNILVNCYLNSLKEASNLNVDTIIFPSLGTGVYNCPFDESVECVKEALVRYLVEYKERPNKVRNIIFSLASNEAVDKYGEVLGVGVTYKQ